MDAISKLTGSIFGIEMVVQGIFLPYAENQGQLLQPRPELAELGTKFDETDQELDALFTMFAEARKELDEEVKKHNEQ